MYNFDFDVPNRDGNIKGVDFTSPDTDFVYFQAIDKSEKRNLHCFLSGSACEKVKVHKVSNDGVEDIKSKFAQSYQHRNIYSDTIDNVECSITENKFFYYKPAR